MEPAIKAKTMSKLIRILLLVIISIASNVYAFNIEKKDYLSLIVGNYVHGFKEFDTSVTSFDDSVSIAIYYDKTTQDEKRAKQLASRFRTHISGILGKYSWTKGVIIKVNVYSEERVKREY